MEYILGVILVLFIYFALGWRRISPVYYGIIYILGRYGANWGWQAKEGWLWIPPIIGKLVEYPATFMPFEIKAKVFTQETGGKKNKRGRTSLGVELRISGTRRPDYGLLDRYRKWFVALDKDLTAELEARLQDVAGKYEALEFTSRHDDIERLINCLLRLNDDVMPHRHGTRYKDKHDNNYTRNNIPPEDVLDFYKKNAVEVDKLIDNEHKNPYRSYIEQRYGVDFGRIHLSAPDFDEETKRAFAAKVESEQRLKAVASKSGMVKKLMDEHRGLSAREAFNEVDHTLGAPKHIYSIEGNESGNVGLWLTPENKPGPRTEPKKGGSNGPDQDTDRNNRRHPRR
ncbi:MAG: hypothetical protein HY456_01450 [Parcubacteria group bacterium]|nr:hypothetical protein [Parcubacteria group bacterium]